MWGLGCRLGVKANACNDEVRLPCDTTTTTQGIVVVSGIPCTTSYLSSCLHLLHEGPILHANVGFPGASSLHVSHLPAQDFHIRGAAPGQPLWGRTLEGKFSLWHA